MTIQVLFFASMREQVGMSEIALDVIEDMTVRDVWNTATGGLDVPENTLVAVNQDYVNWRAVVSSGDEVAFFPPVTGG